MTSRDCFTDRFTETSSEPRSTPLSVLYSALEDTKKYEGWRVPQCAST